MITNFGINLTIIVFVTGHGWLQLGILKSVTAGVTGVWGIDVNDLIMYRSYTGSTFNLVASTFLDLVLQAKTLNIARGYLIKPLLWQDTVKLTSKSNPVQFLTLVTRSVYLVANFSNFIIEFE